MDSMNKQPKPGTHYELDENGDIFYHDSDVANGRHYVQGPKAKGVLIDAANSLPSLSARLEGVEAENKRLREALEGMLAHRGECRCNLDEDTGPCVSCAARSLLQKGNAQ